MHKKGCTLKIQCVARDDFWGKINCKHCQEDTHPAQGRKRHFSSVHYSDLTNPYTKPLYVNLHDISINIAGAI